MKSFSQVRLIVLLVIATAFGAAGARATNSIAPISIGFLLNAYNLTTTVNTTNVYFTNNPVTTFITVSNANPFFQYSTTYITNQFSQPVTFAFSDTDTNLTAITNGDTLIFSELYSAAILTTNQVIQISFTWTPKTTGTITNTITVGNNYITNTATTNLVVNQIYAGNATLTVTNYIISEAYITNEWVITNDWVTYGVTVSNTGPGSAGSVYLTNTLPPGISLLSASKGYTQSGTNLVFSVGNLTNGGAENFQFTILPVTNGAYALEDILAAPNVYQPGGTNEVAVEELYVTNYLDTLGLGTISAQSVDYQNGLVEQTIQVVNDTSNTVPAVRVVITGLTNQLFNAGGTNNAQPLVVYPAALAPGAAVSFRLQYLPRGTYPWYFPLTNGQIHAYAVPASVLNYTPGPFIQASTNITIGRFVQLTDGDMLLEYSAVLGRSYTIVYSTNADFSNPMIATPAYVSPANEVQWLDYGPPATISAPTNASQRFYRVYLNP